MIGKAYTVNAVDDFLTILIALKDVVEDEILVIKGSSEFALAGEMFVLEAKNRNLAGIIVDGSVRDTSSIKEIRFPVYARTICPKACNVEKIYETRTTIKIGKLEISQGDILFGDDDGIILIPLDSIEDVILKAKEIQTSENKIIQRLKKGESLFHFLNFDEHLENVKNSKDSRLRFKL